MPTDHSSPVTRHRLVLIGANGMLASAVRECAPAEYCIIPLDLPDFDLTDREQVLECLGQHRPEVIVNCAAYTNVDGCESEEALATLVNGAGPGYLAEAALQLGATLVHISTDYVFDGQKAEPYLETDLTAPLSAYGRSKLAGEKAIMESGLEQFFIIRTSWLYGPGGSNFVETILRLAGEREELRIVADQVGSPTYTGDLAEAIFALLDTVTGDESRVTSEKAKNSGETVKSGKTVISDELSEPTGHPSPVTAPNHPSPLFGLYHFSNEGSCSWQEFACSIVEEARSIGVELQVKNILPIRTEEYPLPAPRPAFSLLSKERYQQATGRTVPPWQESLERYFEVRQRS